MIMDGTQRQQVPPINLFDKNSVETSIIDKMSGRNFINGARANDCHLIYP